jgi:hypothetical protein
MESTSAFSMIINFTDEAGIWNTVWSSLRTQLNLHFVSIKYRNNSVMKPLSTLNLKMKNTSTFQPDNFHLHITKVSSIGNLKQFRENFLADLERFKNAMFIFVMDIENSETSLKNSLKLFEKLKLELRHNDIKLLPVNPNFGKLSELISVFFQDFKNRISVQLSSKIHFSLREIDKYKITKNDSKDNTFTYLTIKDSLLGYLTIAEFWEECLRLLEEDLYGDFGYLNNSNNFNEPNSFLDFNEGVFRLKIADRSITNLQYQQYIMIQICRFCRLMRDFEKLNNYIVRIFNDITQLRTYFNSIYLFSFWSYLLTLRLVAFLKSLRPGLYNSHEEAVNVRSQLTVLNYMKKYLRNYASLIKIEIPGLKLFSILFKSFNNFDELESKIKNKILENEKFSNAFLEKNELYNNFKLDIKGIDDKTKDIILSRQRFYEEYYIVLNNIEQLNLQFKMNKLNFKTQMEKLSLILVNSNSSKLIQLKEIVLGLIKQVKDKWTYLYNILHVILLLVIFHSDKSEENLNLMFKLAEEKLNNLEEISKLLGIEDRKISLYDFISDYFNNQNLFKGNKFSLDINWTFDLRIGINEKYNERIYLGGGSKAFNLAIEIQNNSEILFKLDKIRLYLKSTEGEDFIELSSKEDLKPSSKVLVKKQNFEISSKLINLNNHSIEITFGDIILVLSSGIEFKYQLPKSNLAIIVKDNNLLINTKIFNEDLEHVNLLRGTNYYDRYSMIFYNTIYRLEIILQNFDSISGIDNKNIKVKIFLTDEEGKYDFISNIRVLSTNFTYNTFIEDNCITLNDEFKFYPETTLIVHFVIEDTIFNKVKNNIIMINIDVIDSRENKLFTNIKDQHVLVIQHLFYLTQRLRFLPNENVLAQISLNNNSDYKNLKVFFDERFNELEPASSQVVNFVKILNKRDSEILKKQMNEIFFDYYLDNVKFRLYYPVSFIESELFQLLKIPYFIKIFPENNKEKPDGFEINKLLILKVVINKYLKDDTYIMIKIKDSENWTIVGKSRQIERIKTDEIKLEIDLNLIPLNDGFLKLPEIDFMEYRYVNNDENKSFKNVNTLEFLPLPHSSVIEGNDRIVKIYSSNTMMLKLNFV